MRLSDDIKGPITIFPTYTDPITGNQINITIVLEGCFWDEDSGEIFKNTGQQTANSVSVYIPLDENITGLKFISPDEWIKLSAKEVESGKYWSIPRPTNQPSVQRPLMVKGRNEFKFEWAGPTAGNRITVQEANLLKENPNVRRVIDVNVNDYGSNTMRHVLLMSR